MRTEEHPYCKALIEAHLACLRMEGFNVSLVLSLCVWMGSRVGPYQGLLGAVQGLGRAEEGACQICDISAIVAVNAAQLRTSRLSQPDRFPCSRLIAAGMAHPSCMSAAASVAGCLPCISAAGVSHQCSSARRQSGGWQLSGWQGLVQQEPRTS